MQLDRRKFFALVNQREVEERQAVGVDVIAGGTIAEGSHYIDRRPQVLWGDEKIDVASEAPSGITIERLTKHGPLQRRRLNPGLAEARHYTNRDQLQK